MHMLSFRWPQRLLPVGCASPLCYLFQFCMDRVADGEGDPEECCSLTRWSARCQGVVHLQDAEWMQKHSCRVQALISRLLQAGTLCALQVAAVHSSLCIDIGRLAASGLQHLALACERLKLEGGCGNSRPPPVPSMHLFTWVRPLKQAPGWQLPPDHCLLSSDVSIIATVVSTTL